MEIKNHIDDIILPATERDIDKILSERDDVSNLVDERFELLSLVFRLAERNEYNDLTTDYHREISETFAEYKKHKAVKYAVELPLGYDAVFQFAVHIVKENGVFVFIKELDSLLNDGRWNKKSLKEFLELLNDFYTETDYAAFYNSKIPFFEEETKRFVNETYGAINFEWFGKYVDIKCLRCIWYPSATGSNYGATVNGKYVYCAVSGDGSSIVHEFCHSFANPLADKWYADNAQFKKRCDDSVDIKKHPHYSMGWIMAREYVTRAYNFLYNHENGVNTNYFDSFEYEKTNGFPYIEEVYNMILELDAKLPAVTV
jgi:hypothetical protein